MPRWVAGRLPRWSSRYPWQLRNPSWSAKSEQPFGSFDVSCGGGEETKWFRTMAARIAPLNGEDYVLAEGLQKCGGDLYLEKDEFGSYVFCLQCGATRYDFDDTPLAGAVGAVPEIPEQDKRTA